MLLLEQMLLFKMVSTSKRSIHYVLSCMSGRRDVHERETELSRYTFSSERTVVLHMLIFLAAMFFFLFLQGRVSLAVQFSKKQSLGRIHGSTPRLLAGSQLWDSG